MTKQKGIVFFKKIPDRDWNWDNPYTKYDIASQKCLSYSQMNNNLSNLEGRDIKSIDVDENCNPVINLVNGTKLTVKNEFCSGKGGVLQEDLDYSQMFVDGGCCYSTRHFGWLGQYGNTGLDSHYNTNEGDYFPAGTSIEYVLRQILVSNGDLKPNVIKNLSCSSAHRDDNNYSWSFTDESTSKSGYTFSGTVTVNHTGDNAYVNNNCQLATNGCCDNGKVCLTNLLIKQNGSEIADYNDINLTINIKVNIQAKPVTPTVAEAYFIYNTESETLPSGVITDINTIIAEVETPYTDPDTGTVTYYSKTLQTGVPSGAQGISASNVNTQDMTYYQQISLNATPYYFVGQVVSNQDALEHDFRSVLVISDNFQCNPLNLFHYSGGLWYYDTLIEYNVNNKIDIDGYKVYGFASSGGLDHDSPICMFMKQS